MNERFSVWMVSACGRTSGVRPPRLTTPSTLPTAWSTEATSVERDGSTTTAIDAGAPVPADAASSAAP